MQPARVIAILLSCIVVACSPDFQAPPAAPSTLRSLVVLYPSAGTLVTVGSGSVTFAAYTVDSDDVYTNVTQQAEWSTSNPRVVEFSGAAARFAFRGTGDGSVIARYQGLVGVLPIDVRSNTPQPMSIQISLTSSTAVPPRTSVSFWNPAVGTRTVTSEVTWSSSDERIAAITERGVMTLGAPGNVRITAAFQGMTDFYWMSVPPRTR